VPWSGLDRFHKEMTSCHNTISDLRKKIGLLSCKLIEITSLQKETVAKSKLAEIKLEMSKAMQMH
jgi:hypothetical protein